jgi:hypothetical protein
MVEAGINAPYNVAEVIRSWAADMGFLKNIREKFGFKKAARELTVTRCVGAQTHKPETVDGILRAVDPLTAAKVELAAKIIFTPLEAATGASISNAYDEHDRSTPAEPLKDDNPLSAYRKVTWERIIGKIGSEIKNLP